MKCNNNHLFISRHWEIKRIGLVPLEKKSAHEVIRVVQISYFNIEQINMVNTIYCSSGNGYF